MKEQPKAGRPPKADRTRMRKNRTLTFSDPEYDELGRQAENANMNKSEYIIRKLKLSNPL